ncbi:MAG: glycosyltransferase family 2 protein [Candidatus Dormibacteria bacterium]
MARAPLASILIPVLDRVENLAACLLSLARLTAPTFETVVVANGTSEDALAGLPDPESLVLVRSPVNLGFGGGCNWGARVTRGRYVVVLNDDTEVELGWLQALVAVAQSDPRIGAVGSRLLDPDGTLQEAGSLLWSDAGTHQVGRGLPPGSAAYKRVRDVDYCSGCGLLVTREAWDEVGGFDEAFFPGYFEDVDLCLSLRSRGYRVVYAPSARLRHLGGGSTDPAQRSAAAVRNGRRFIAKWSTALADYAPQPTARDRDRAVSAAIDRAERRPLPARRAGDRGVRPPEPLTEMEALRILARSLEAALALDDQLLLELGRRQAKLGRLRCAAGRVPLGRRVLAWASQRLER